MVESGVYRGGINTSDGWGKSLSSVNLGNLLDGNTFRVVTEARKVEIRRKIPLAKHYIVYPEKLHGQKDLNTGMRRETRASRCWQIVKLSFADNSFFAERIREEKTDF